jgi:hypothetical protein
MSSGGSIASMNAASAPSTARRRIDVKAIMGMHLRPYAIVKNWRNEFEILKEHCSHFARDVNGRVMALREDCSDWDSRVETLLLACDLRDALPPLAVIAEAQAMILAALQAPFDEPAATLLVGVMLDAMPAKPGEGAAVYLDAMMFTLGELRLDDEGEILVPTAAIAAAVQDVWKDKTFKPAISEFVGYVLKHWHKLRADLRAVRGLRSFVATLDELGPAETEAPPVAWCDGHTDDGSIPF